MKRTVELFDPFDDALHDDPYPTYRVLRDEHPVYENRERAFFALSRYEDVHAATCDPATYTSGSGITLDDMGTAALPMLLTLDPPRHDELRRLANRAFTPSRVVDLERVVRDSIAACLLEARDQANFDAVSGLAARVPMDTIATMIGIPGQDLPQFRQWVRDLLGVDPGASDMSAEVAEVIGQLVLYVSDLVEQRRATPADDLASALIDAEEGGQELDHQELLGFLLMLLAAGIETTTNLLSTSLTVLAQHPDVRRRLAGETELLSRCVEEILRYDTPVPGFFRTLSREVELHDVAMPSGGKVLLMYGSANRDDRVFADPDRFDLDRRGEPHIAFGHGAHFCLGAALARLEARVVLEEVLAHAPTWDVDLERSVRLRSAYARGFESLPVSLFFLS